MAMPGKAASKSKGRAPCWHPPSWDFRISNQNYFKYW